ncbi:hypothetical protein C0991_003911 [Blastosporella zonata]|nr:hypothetical protein C0991_003911 [Blastosporella zonata]
MFNSLLAASYRTPVLLHSASKSVYIYDESPAEGNRQHASRVAVISGGGAGHEPAHAGYTGRGMLSASVSGDIFASPSATQILQTLYLASSSGACASEAEQTTSVHGWKDVLVIINNYTGDRLNFGLAIEKALASSQINVGSVVVADDVSLLQSTLDGEHHSRKSLVGARGLAGNILVCKILGAFAQRGSDLALVKLLGDAVVHSLASVGIGLGHCHVPGRELSSSSATVTLAEEECEIGLGLHNEPGVVRKRMEGPDKLVGEMLDLIMRSKGTGAEFLRVSSREKSDSTDDTVLFVNNLGGMSQLELGALLDEVLGQLASIGVHPMRVYCSAYMTSLNAPGFSISILNISSVDRFLSASSIWNASASVLDLLDDPTDAVAWVGVSRWPMKRNGRDTKEDDISAGKGATPLLPEPTRDIRQMESASGRAERGIRSACEYVLLQQDALTEFDTILGDGDCGNTFGTGARAILNILDRGSVNVTRMAPHQLIKFLGDVLEDRMGGTIGALLAIFLTAVSASLKDSPEHWGRALIAGLKSLGKYTPAKPGDRTLIDALAPFCETLAQDENDLENAVDVTRRGAESTRSMPAVLGRAAYVTLPKDVENLPPDPGAWGVLAIVEGLVRGLSDGN